VTVLVLGATGFIGGPLVRALRAMGAEVVAASRGGGGPDGVAADRGDAGAVLRLVRARGVRTVIDLIAYTQGDTLPLFEALGGHAERYVLASSMDVYRNYEGLHRKAAVDPIPGPLSESSPLRTTPFPYRAEPPRRESDPEAWLDRYDKIPLEAALRRSDLRHTIARLPMVYGPGDRQRRFRWAIGPMLRARPHITIDPTWAAWRTTYGFVDDVAHGLAHAARHPAAADQTFNLGEADPPDHARWLARFAGRLGWSGAVRLEGAPPGNPLAALDLGYTLVADTRAMRETCDWREPTPLEEALERTVADERSRQGSVG
jgi:nucleoside-diphosphate-sugar epimerase